MKSITSREDVIQFLQEHNTPLLQCEFMMVISLYNKTIGSETRVEYAGGGRFNISQGGSVSYKDWDLPDTVLLTAFDCPDSGISWSIQPDKFGFLRASLKYSQINVSFISPVEDTFSPIHKYYDMQFTEDGLIKARNDTFAEVKIFALVEDTSHLLFSCSGCRFSYPLPVIDLSNAKASVFKTVISYNSFRYGI